MELIGSDAGYPTSTAEEQKILFEAIPSIATSFVNKQGCPKKSRWFSWFDSAFENLAEWHCCKMLLHWNAPDIENPDALSAGTLQSIRSNNVGGLRLALRCMDSTTFRLAHVMYIIGQPCWAWYGWQTKHVLSSEEYTNYNIEMSLQWRKDWHLQRIANFLSMDEQQPFEWLARQCSSDAEQTTLAEWIVTFDVALLASRCATLSKHDAPPYSYAVLLGGDLDQARTGLAQMRSDFTMLMTLELNPSKTAQNLAADMRQCFDSVTRLMALHFERCHWILGPGCEPGLDILRLICGSISDSKSIEDVRKDIKKHQKKGSNEKLSSYLIQSIVNSSSVIQRRKWLHAAKVVKPVFIKKWHSTSNKFPKERFQGKSRKGLPARFSRILHKQKHWPALSAKTLTCSFASFAWAREFQSKNLKHSNVKLKDSKLKLIIIRVKHHVLCKLIFNQ